MKKYLIIILIYLEEVQYQKFDFIIEDLILLINFKILNFHIFKMKFIYLHDIMLELKVIFLNNLDYRTLAFMKITISFKYLLINNNL